MEINNHINLNRLYLLSRRHVLSNAKAWAIAFGAIAGTLLIISLLAAYFRPPNMPMPSLVPMFLTIMFIGGYIFTSNIFNELHTTRKAMQYLTLPVSTTERLLSAWILTAIIFPIVSVIAITLIILTANLVMNLVLDFRPFQSIFTETGFAAFRTYFITQSVFLLGAAYFRKNNFLKTLLTLFVLSMIFIVVIGVFSWILLSPLSDGSGVALSTEGYSIQMESIFTQVVPGVAKAIFYYVSVPFFLVVSWFTLKERQV